MKNVALINKFGKLTGWNSLTLNVFGRDIEGLTEVSYDDNVEIEGVKAVGGFDIGYGEGNYEAKFSFTVLEEERRAMLDALPTGVMIQEVDGSAVISYETGNKVYKDTIPFFKILNNGVAVKQNDKSIAYKFDCYCPKINWSVK